MATKHIAAPLSADKIEVLANKCRNVLCVPPYYKYAEILDIMENIIPASNAKYQIEIVAKEEIDGEEARTTFKTNPAKIVIQVSRGIYENAKNGCARARFTLAHELGHMMMHGNGMNRSFARAPNVLLYENHSTKIQTYRDAEWQANKFASYFLMPSDLLKNGISIHEVMSEFGVSNAAAKARLEEAGRSKGKVIGPKLKNMIEDLMKGINDNR